VELVSLIKTECLVCGARLETDDVEEAAKFSNETHGHPDFMALINIMLGVFGPPVSDTMRDTAKAILDAGWAPPTTPNCDMCFDVATSKCVTDSKENGGDTIYRCDDHRCACAEGTRVDL
jgi:hypothetical protein